MKSINAFRLLLISVALAAFAVGCGVFGGSETVKIGLLSPQTGPIAQYAPGFEDAGKVAISELNATHDGDYTFELIVGDSGCDGTQAATSSQTLIDSVV